VAYRALHQIVLADDSLKRFNVGQHNEVKNLIVCLPQLPLDRMRINLDLDFEILFRRGLISTYKTHSEELSPTELLPYATLSASTLGIHLYAVAFNKLREWRLFGKQPVESLYEIPTCELFAPSLDGLKAKIA